MRTRERIDPSQLDIKDTVVSINRVTKVVKGGKNLSFSALVVVGDGHGVVGFGVGKATGGSSSGTAWSTTTAADSRWSEARSSQPTKKTRSCFRPGPTSPASPERRSIPT